MKSRLRRWRWKHGAQVSHHLLMLTLQATLNAFNPLLEMLKRNPMLIYASLETLKPSSEASLLLICAIFHKLKFLLWILKLRCEVSLILIHAIFHEVESSITYYNKLLHASAQKANLSRYIDPSKVHDQEHEMPDEVVSLCEKAQ